MNNTKEKFSFKKRMKSFRFAFNGLKWFLQGEHNAWIHCVATLMVIGFAVYYKISRVEWIAICIVVAMVFCSEILNTTIEKLCDIVSPQKSESIKHIKDMSAAAVLICTIAACIIGIIIFLPKI